MGQLDFLRDVFYSLKWATHISGPLGNILSAKCAETFKNGVKTLKMPAAGEENFCVFDSLMWATHLSGPKSDQTPRFHLSGPAHLSDLSLYTNRPF